MQFYYIIEFMFNRICRKTKYLIDAIAKADI